MTETPEQRRARLTIASHRAAAVRTAAAIDRALAKFSVEQLATELVSRGYIVTKGWGE